MFKIGEIEIKNKVILAPMAGVTNRPYRLMVKKFQPGYMCTEMTSNVALKYGSEKTDKLSFVGKDEGIVALQIFGGDVDDYIKAAEYHDKHSNAQIIDINMGCPVKKVAIKSEAGSALMKTPEKIKHIVEGIVSKINKPLTVKIRIGWDDESANYKEVAQIIEKAGASALIVHGRTREQMYTGKANWDAIKEIKECLTIPVIGNGDIFEPNDAIRMLEYTGVDAVMVARSARSKPWIIGQINDLIQGAEIRGEPNLQKIKKMIMEYIELMLVDNSENKTLAQVKGVASQWLSNVNGNQKNKNKFMVSKTLSEFIDGINSFK